MKDISGLEDVKASKQFYVARGLEVAKSFGGKYAGVSPEGSGPHGIALRTEGEGFVDPDGFVWEGA